MRNLLAALCLALVAAGAAAAPVIVQVGDARLALAAPPGFSDTGFTGSPRLQELAESLTSASNRILLFAISDADLRRFMAGDAIEAKRYMVAVTPRGLERERVNRAAFATYASESLAQLGAAAPAGSDLAKVLDAAPGRMQLLGELRRESELVSVLQGARLEPQGRGEKPYYVLATTTLLLLRGKAVNLTVHALYESPADLDWIRGVTARWAEDLQRLNTR